MIMTFSTGTCSTPQTFSQTADALPTPPENMERLQVTVNGIQIMYMIPKKGPAIPDISQRQYGKST